MKKVSVVKLFIQEGFFVTFMEIEDSDIMIIHGEAPMEQSEKTNYLTVIYQPHKEKHVSFHISYPFPSKYCLFFSNILFIAPFSLGHHNIIL